MFDLYYAGGPLFMSLVTLEGFLLIAICIRAFLGIKKGTVRSVDDLFPIRVVGTLALMTGLLGQITGLYQAMQAIEAAGDISMSLLAGGLRISSIVTIYGILWYLAGLCVWLAINTMRLRSQEA